MRVKIGKYSDRLMCNLYRNYMDKKYGFVDYPNKQSKFEDRLEWIDDRIQDVYNVFNRLWFDRRQRKIKVHIDPWDTWSMDHTLALIVLPMLKQLKATNHGAPYVDDKDVPKHLKSTSAPELTQEEKDCGATDAFHFERWNWVMDEMIFAFEQKTLDSWEEQYYGEWVVDESKTFGGYHINADEEGRKKHQERMTNGFRLFGKYYENLWD